MTAYKTPGPDPQGKIGQILVAAGELFLRDGYGNTSMDAVAKHAGVSKSTLYAHFENKEQLFGAVIGYARQGLHATLAGITATGDRDIARTLRQIGTQFLRYVTDKSAVTIFRVVIGESGQFPKLGRELFQASGDVLVELIAESLERWTGRGLLAVPDPALAARQFLALVKVDLQLRCLLDSDRATTEAEIKRNVDEAVAMFLSRYGPQGG